MKLANSSAADETAAFLSVPAGVPVPRLGSSLDEVRTWLRARPRDTVLMSLMVLAAAPVPVTTDELSGFMTFHMCAGA